MENKIETDWNQLIKRIQAGEDAAYSEFVDLTHVRLMQFCLYLTQSKQFAEDILHDTYLKAFTSIKTLREPLAVQGWLKQIARFLFLDYIKSAAHKNEIHTEVWQDLDQRETDDKVGVRRDVLKVLNQLSEEDRSILILIDVQESSYDEAATALDIPGGTVKSRLFRAREKFSLLYNGTKKQRKSS